MASALQYSHPETSRNSGLEKLSVVMLLAYGDESIDETSTRVCSAGVVIGTEEQWKDMESKWIGLTNGTPFHANDCDSDKGIYKAKLGEDTNEKHKQNKALYRELIILLANSGLHGFAATMDIAALKNAYPNLPDHCIYYKVASDVMELTKNAAMDKREIAKITFDSRSESAFNITLVYANMREENPEWKTHLADEISFALSNDNARIQVGDLFAREAMKDLDNQIGPVKRPTRRSWNALTESGRFKSYNYSTDWFRELIPDLPRLTEIEGFTREDYKRWLETRNRQDNLTAYLEFYHWHRTQH